VTTSDAAGRSRLPWGVGLCALSAFVAASPTLFLRPDVSTSVRAAVMAIGAVLFVAGVVRVRIETRPPTQADTPDADRHRGTGTSPR